MSTYYNKVVKDLGNIVDAIEYYENELLEARFECGTKETGEQTS